MSDRGLVEVANPSALFLGGRSSAEPGTEAREPAAASVEQLSGSAVFAGIEGTRPVLVDPEVMKGLEALVPLAPLHQPHNLGAIRAVAEHAPQLPQVACFDTAFHRTQPAVAQAFALPRRYAEEGVLRYGFHGLSYEYVASVLPGEGGR